MLAFGLTIMILGILPLGMAVWSLIRSGEMT
jgi:hypothetical protein